ncbi:uncharacterized protein LOC126845320 [Adelges cooleyi]|uniref:uncharacterized protein LOC126845320 n=1 Tax=Adelges cooleyi TaxID=133065 RepID=UPI00217F29FC|nr:uncharacterized protein LOC126845320 [Adelges cooleyi]
MTYLVKPFFNRQTYMRYSPNKILLFDLLYRGEHDTDQESKPDDLALLRNVTLATRLEEGTYPNIDLLFSIAQRVFNVKCVESFQQQVLVATAQPVLSVVGSYLCLVKQMFYTGDGKLLDIATRATLFEERINDLGDFVLNVFVGFIRLGLYLEKDLDYLKKTALGLDDLVKHNDKKNMQVGAEWIGQIFRRCSNPMSLNYLTELNEEEFVNVNSAENYNNAINTLIMKAGLVGNYVTTLDKYKNIYQEVVFENPFFFHDYMFLYRPECDIIKDTRHGYDEIGYSVLKESKPKV